MNYFLAQTPHAQQGTVFKAKKQVVVAAISQVHACGACLCSTQATRVTAPPDVQVPHPYPSETALLLPVTQHNDIVFSRTSSGCDGQQPFSDCAADQTHPHTTCSAVNSTWTSGQVAASEVSLYRVTCHPGYSTAASKNWTTAQQTPANAAAKRRRKQLRTYMCKLNQCDSSEAFANLLCQHAAQLPWDLPAITATISRCQKLYSASGDAHTRDQLHSLLQQQWEPIFLQHVSKLDTAGIGIVMHSAAMLGYQSDSVTDSLLCQAYQKRSTFRPRSFAMLLHGLAKLQHKPPGSWLQGLLAVQQPHLQHSFTPQDLSMTIWSLAAFNFLPSRTWLDAWYHAVEQKAQNFDARSLSLTLWSLTQLGCLPQQSFMHSLAGQAQLLLYAQPEQFGQETFAELVYSLAIFCYLPSPNFCQALYQASLQRLHTFTPQSLALVAMGTERWKYIHPPPDVWLHQLYIASEFKMHGFSALGLVLLLSAVSTHSCKPSSSWVQCLERQLEQLNLADLKTSASAKVLIAFAHLQYRPSKLCLQHVLRNIIYDTEGVPAKLYSAMLMSLAVLRIELSQQHLQHLLSVSMDKLHYSTLPWMIQELQAWAALGIRPHSAWQLAFCQAVSAKLQLAVAPKVLARLATVTADASMALPDALLASLDRVAERDPCLQSCAVDDLHSINRALARQHVQPSVAWVQACRRRTASAAVIRAAAGDSLSLCSAS